MRFVVTEMHMRNSRFCSKTCPRRQDLDAIHTQYIRKVFWDPQRKGSRHEMLAWTDVPVHHTDLCFCMDG
ncbi:hypothetical protein F2P79_025711 [Pimephales promelas]|nr:hypothetical protein F2P79_025711 [Pimephales promelas]